MDDNPNLLPEFVEAQKRLYTGFFYKRFIEGLWVMAEGAIYKDSWSEELLYDEKDEPAGLRTRGGHAQRIIPIDYGTTDPMVFLDIYDDGKLFWVAREYYWNPQCRCSRRPMLNMPTIWPNLSGLTAMPR